MVKINERTCGKEKKSIGTLQSIKVLPVTPTFKVQETKRNKNNVHVAKVHGKVPILSKQIRGKSQQICSLLCVRSNWNVTF